MAQVNKVYKYGTGDEIPKGAVYLKTVVEMRPREGRTIDDKEPNRFVWHYFLVKVVEEES